MLLVLEKILKNCDGNRFNQPSKQSNNRAENLLFNKSVDKYLLKSPYKNGKVTLPSSISSGQKTYIY